MKKFYSSLLSFLVALMFFSCSIVEQKEYVFINESQMEVTVHTKDDFKLYPKIQHDEFASNYPNQSNMYSYKRTISCDEDFLVFTYNKGSVYKNGSSEIDYKISDKKVTFYVPEN